MTATAKTRLYVATDLDTWEASTPEPDQDTICERCGYRRLDPTYYAWLRYRMEVAKHTSERRRIPAAQYQDLRRRFNEVHFWALAHFGEAALVAAVKALDPKAYQPPRVEGWPPSSTAQPEPAPEHLYPAEGSWRFTEKVSWEVVAQVATVRDLALSLGWSERTLYQNRGQLRFPAGDQYGLVCFLRSGDQIGEVTAQSIEIIAASGSRSRLYNWDVKQPWLHSIPSRVDEENPDTSAVAPVSNK